MYAQQGFYKVFLICRALKYYAHFGNLFRHIGRNRAKPDALSSLKTAARSSTFVHFPRRFARSVRKIFPELLLSPYSCGKLILLFRKTPLSSRFGDSLDINIENGRILRPFLIIRALFRDW